MLLGEAACAKNATQAATVTAARDTPTSTVVLSAGKRTLFNRLARSNRIAQCSELPRARLSAGTGKGVDRIRQLDIHQPGGADHRLPPCTRQGAGDSTSPQINVV